jgi:hypothetical protein
MPIRITARAFRRLPARRQTAISANHERKAVGPVEALFEQALDRGQRAEKRGQRQGLAGGWRPR